MRGNYLYARRISNNSSILEIELCHKKSSYPCTAFTQQSVYILTDSSAMHSLQKLPPDDNFHLITSALLKLQQLDQGNSVHIMWMMCHGVKDSLRLAQVCIIHTSISHIKKQARKASFRVQRQVWVQAGSPSTVWYKAVTDYQPIIISRSMKRRDATTYTRFRLGSRCHWEIEKRVPRDCQHCQTIFDKPLLHYILPCSLLEQTKTTALLYICLTKSS